MTLAATSGNTSLSIPEPIMVSRGVQTMNFLQSNNLSATDASLRSRLEIQDKCHCDDQAAASQTANAA